jgi:hypothetical protein
MAVLVGPGVAVRGAVEEALARRDRALAALDEGDFPAALVAAGKGLAVLEVAGLCGGPDEAALLVALAEIQEGAGQVGEARVTVVAAIAILERAALDLDDDLLTLWCQAHGHLAAGPGGRGRAAGHPGLGDPGGPAPGRPPARDGRGTGLAGLRAGGLTGRPDPGSTWTLLGSPDRIRTGVTALRGRRPRPLDDGAEH